MIAARSNAQLAKIGTSMAAAGVVYIILTHVLHTKSQGDISVYLLWLFSPVFLAYCIERCTPQSSELARFVAIFEVTPSQFLFIVSSLTIVYAAVLTLAFHNAAAIESPLTFIPLLGVTMAAFLQPMPWSIRSTLAKCIGFLPVALFASSMFSIVFGLMRTFHLMALHHIFSIQLIFGVSLIAGYFAVGKLFPSSYAMPVPAGPRGWITSAVRFKRLAVLIAVMYGCLQYIVRYPPVLVPMTFGLALIVDALIANALRRRQARR